MSSIIPIPSVHLQTLYNNLDFLAEALDGQKPCFRKRCYVDSKSWIGTIYRFFESEEQSSYGNAFINSICIDAAQTYNKELKEPTNTNNNIILLNKIVLARNGINRIQITYKSIGKIDVAIKLSNSIGILDNIIPDERKQLEDIIP